MADNLYFSRDTRVFIKLTGQDFIWEVPVLDGFSFSQATNATEVSLSEMESTAGVSNRGRQMFNDSYAPADWSFSTYARPYFASSKDRSVEEVLWGLIAGKAYWDNTNKAFNKQADLAAGAGSVNQYIKQVGNLQEINFSTSNTSTLGTADIYFIMGGNRRTVANDTVTAYKIEKCVVNEVAMDFDIDGIATLNWSGFGSIISEVNAYTQDANPADSSLGAGTNPIGSIWLDTDHATAGQIFFAKTVDFGIVTTPFVAGISSTDNYIKNKLSSLDITSSDIVSGSPNSYTLTLTGGSITISNNVTYITPETLGVVNQPIGHVTGTRSVSGSFTCYLDSDLTTSSADLFEDSIEGITNVTNDVDLDFSIGGNIDANGPSVNFRMNHCHIEIPQHSIEDVISLETNFHALPNGFDGTDELVVSYVGKG